MPARRTGSPGPALIAEPTTTRGRAARQVELTVTELGDYLLEPR